MGITPKIAVLLIAHSASAEVLKTRQVDSTNLHMADQRGAMHWSEDITITVDLGAKGRVEVISKGMRGDHQMDVINGATYNTDETTTWTTTWKGTWKIAKDSLVLDLALRKDACSAVKEEQGTKTQGTCKAARKSAVMRCQTTSVEVGDQKQQIAAWRCTPDDARDLGETPVSWVLGKDRCIEVHAGRRAPISYAPCPSASP